MIFAVLCLVGCFLWPVEATSQEYANNHVPAYTQDGAPNLVYHWIEGGGARLYWRSVPYPKQVRLMGSQFRDPADVPILKMYERPPKKYYGRRKVKVRKARKRPVKQVVRRNLPKPKEQPKSQVKLGPVKAKTTTAQAKPKAKTVPMQAADSVGKVPPERLQ